LPGRYFPTMSFRTIAGSTARYRSCKETIRWCSCSPAGRCRLDWDISSVAHRTAWEKGEKAGFYPYGKTQAQVLAE